MSIKLVNYDLYMPNESAYTGFYGKLRSYNHCWGLKGVCFLNTESSPSNIEIDLMPSLGGHDSLFVCDIGEDWVTSETHCEWRKKLGAWVEEGCLS